MFRRIAVALATFTVGVVFLLSASTTYAAALPPSISLEKTVGLSSSTCATNDTLVIGGPETVYYCYTVTNTGDVTLTRHDLEDSELGTILSDFPFTLVPGASAFITQSESVSSTIVNTATWTARNPATGADVSASDSATVTLGTPTISLVKTVGLSSSTCAANDTLNLTDPATVYYCYTVTNTGDLTVTRHDLVDSELGTILSDFPFTLVPGASAFITQSASITITTVNTAVWTARNPGGNPASATDVATVTVEGTTAVSLSALAATADAAPITAFAAAGVLLLIAGIGLLKR